MENEIKIANCGCGGNGKILKINENSFFITCSKCHTDSGIYSTEAEAINAWNRAMGAKDINVPNKERTAKVTNIHERIGENTVFTLIGKCECGELVSSWSKYCHNCGARLEWNYE